MRMRRKKNLDSRLAAHSRLQIVDGRAAEAAKGREIYLEVGCGKGRFIAEHAVRNPDTFFIAVEKYANVAVHAIERAAALELDNLLFLSADAATLPEYLGDGAVAGIFINFPDPWPAKRHAKRRLTHRNMLAVLSRLLAPGASIRLKTDDRALFEFSLCELSQSGFELTDVSLDLHAACTDNIMTEYEARFSQMGMKILALTAAKSG